MMKCGNDVSRPLNVISDIPQVLNLGSFLFIIYTTVVMHFIQYQMYADDTMIILKAPLSKVARENTNESLNLLQLWFKANVLL